MSPTKNEATRNWNSKKRGTYFNNTTEAFMFMHELESMINDLRLADWATEMDIEHGTKLRGLLEDAIDAYNKFYDASDI